MTDTQLTIWKPIETAPQPELKLPGEEGPSVLFALPDGRVKEGRVRLVDDYDKMDDVDAYLITFWLANDSCSCCYDRLQEHELPTQWADMPKHPSEYSETK